jgi:uncharacterized protein (DUF58 family)
MRPTRRGVAVALVGAAAVGMAWVAGARALNAVAAPALVALVAAALQVGLAETPTVERTPPSAGVPGDVRPVELEVDGSGVAHVVDETTPGVTTTAAEDRTTLPGTVRYEVEYRTRGEWTLGPPTVAVTDVLGLFVSTTASDATTALVVYPTIYDLRGHAVATDLQQFGRTSAREAFDTIREYTPGDPLRDVHWASSARRSGDDLVVQEFVAERSDEDVHVVASAVPGAADQMAAGAASVALVALDAGLSVSLTCPDGSVPTGSGDRHRADLLELLARTGPGQVSDRATEDADVTVTASESAVRATVNGREHVLAVIDEGAARGSSTRGAARSTAGGGDRDSRVAADGGLGERSADRGADQ